MNKELLIDYRKTVAEAMEILGKLHPKILFVSNEENKLMGSLTDGDIRRFMMTGGDIHNSVYNACNKSPKKVAKSLTEAKTMLSKDYIAIPVINSENVICDIYYGEENKAHGMIDIPVVINAGGKGTRLEPFTKVLPKPLIPVGDLPIIEHIIHKYQEYGCRRFSVVVNYKKELIKTYFNEVDKNYSVEWVDETTPLGTGGSLSLLKGKVNEPFFFISCDNLILADYSKILENHLAKKNAITIVCAQKNLSIPYGVIETNNDNEYLNMKEKPKYSFLTNTATYLINPEIIDDVGENCKIDFPDIIKMEKDKGRKIGVYIIDEDEWLDMGVMPELEKMRARLYGE